MLCTRVCTRMQLSFRTQLSCSGLRWALYSPPPLLSPLPTKQPQGWNVWTSVLKLCALWLEAPFLGASLAMRLFASAASSRPDVGD